jgi:putative endonuclease
MPYHVYILSNRTRVLYVGITSQLATRISQHKAHVVGGFTQRYNVDRLVYVETFADAMTAITREKQIKGYRRSKKVALIERENPEWQDISDQI